MFSFCFVCLFFFIPLAICSQGKVICWQLVKGHKAERLVIVNANCIGCVEKKARQGRMAEWGRRQDKKKPSADSF